MTDPVGIIESFATDCGIDLHLAALFLIGFARIEYALKRSTYQRKGYDSHVVIAWSEFAKDIGPAFVLTEGAPLALAVEYLCAFPPREETFTGEQIPGWKEDDAVAESAGHLAMLRVKTVRNNLFHGAKFPYDPERDGPLLRASLVVLEECLRRRDDLRVYFDAVA